MNPVPKFLAAGLLCLTVLGGARALAADDSRFRIPSTEFGERVKRVGLLPPSLAAEFAERTELKQQIEALLTESLRNAGLEVVSPASYMTAFDTMNRQVGGIYAASDGRPDAEKYKLVTSHARNAFFEAESLDAVVMSVVGFRSAGFEDWTVSWDGVEEASTGQPVGGFAKWNSSNVSLRGRLPALSLGILIEDQDEQPLYSAWGGVQLASYREMPKGVVFRKQESTNGIVDVPVTDLLRDEPRLRRAVEIATWPLRPGQAGNVAPSSGAGTGLPPLPAGRLPVQADPFRVPRDEILARVRSVAILPVGFGAVDPTQVVGLRYDEGLSAEVEKLGWRVVPSKVMADKVREFEASGGGFHDPFTGVLKPEAAAEFRRSVAAAGEPVDAVLWPIIVERSADTDGTNAYWDGAGQNLYNLGPAKRKFWPGDRLGGGVVGALSLRVELRAPDDTLLYEALGGIQVLERMGNSGKEALTSLELFRDPERDDEAIRLALLPLSVAPGEPGNAKEAAAGK